MTKDNNFLAYLYLFLTVTFWAGNFVVGKLASFYEVPPFSLNFYRWLFAWLILAPFTIPEILEKRNYIIKNYKLFIVLGVTSITVFNSIVYYSLNFTQVISGVLMISTIPVMIMLFSSILKIEKTNIFQIIGVVFSFAGVIMIITLLKGKKYELTQISLLQVVITFGLVFLIPVYFIEYQIGFRINLELPFILILSYVVLFPGLASFLLWIKGISMIGANRSGVFLHLMPILSALMAMIFFSEKFMFYHILGACFITTGILLSNKKVKNA